MEIISYDSLNIPYIVDSLKQGKTIVYPTETCYGLGCDATNREAVEKIFEIKHRQKDKSVLVVASDPSIMMEYIEWTPVLEKIAERYWPGPLTVVVCAKNGYDLPVGVKAADDGTIAFRITDHPLASQLSKELGKPIVSTSANLASYKSPYDSALVRAMFDTSIPQPDIIIDAGKLVEHAPSTVIRLGRDGEFHVLRQGEVIVRL
ncbi:MAG: threonylcarbamoyl-AMP synthase [Candidatus Magasanikbacteria bacterium]|nr:threonylcarbamoyl-AMP synthase [Candidatus Magasanikbacteria bacterium]